jgi:hypothetical protein
VKGQTNVEGIIFTAGRPPSARGIAVALNYFLGPAPENHLRRQLSIPARFLHWMKGRRAALEREQGLRQQIIQLRRSAGEYDRRRRLTPDHPCKSGRETP